MVKKENEENTEKIEDVEKKENNEGKDIDWPALDKHWPEQYEKDYGHLFGKK